MIVLQNLGQQLVAPGENLGTNFVLSRARPVSPPRFHCTYIHTYIHTYEVTFNTLFITFYIAEITSAWLHTNGCCFHYEFNRKMVYLLTIISHHTYIHTVYT